MTDAEYIGVTANQLAKIATDLKAENAKLRELVYDMLVDEERGHNDDLTFDEYVKRANELGVEFRA